MSTNEYRLPTNVKPLHYDLTIQTDLDNSLFKGAVKINLDVKDSTSTIILNSNELKIEEAHVRSDEFKGKLAASDISVNVKEKRVIFTFPTTFRAGTHLQLKVRFAGELNNIKVGYYGISYEKDGKNQYYSLTQFEATEARRAFPCWDEPALKATFDITLISKANCVNLSNSAAISDQVFSVNDHSHLALKEVFPTLNDQWKITKFQTTPIMSTYIVAFASGPFEYIESTVTLPISNTTVPLRVYATTSHIHLAQFALDIKAKVLPLYERLFDIPYPLPKLDTLVVHDHTGAMENWGLIIGQADALLVDPGNAATSAKKTVIEMQAHEVAHMWFGNMTTMEWWDYLYLNEGFATLIFDGLSYSKAASVLRMLSTYVGEDKFFKGVSLYLKDHMYGNSVTNDLWEGIGRATGLDIPKLMDNWVKKIGFPVVTVTETPKGIKVRQDRFLATGLAEGKDNETIWSIPLSILTVDSSGKTTIDKTALLDTREKEISLDINNTFKLNAGTNGVYRVLYTSERLEKIAAEAAKSGSCFSLEDKMGLVNDSMALSQAALVKLSSALTLINAMRQEDEYFVWKGISNDLATVAAVWRDHTEIISLLNAFRRSLFSPIVQKLGYTYSNEEPADTTQLRTLAIGACTVAEDMTVVDELRNRFDNYMKTGDDSKIPVDLQKSIYNVAVRYGGREEYNAVKAIYEKPATPTAESAAISALCQASDDSLIKETLHIMLNQARHSDAISFFLGFSVNTRNHAILIDTFKQKYDQLYARFQDTFILKFLIKIGFGSLSTEKDLQETISFFKDKDTTKYSMSLDQALDGIRARIAYQNHSTSDIEAWLKEWKQRTV
ncbi:Aminopeptidase 2 mitochondrial [Stygiomarasmius scandens]|uniref:Aminopeptidase n=1 Tax=Marasmiellus scandens TaxID=2682957 RepID=A0ABR1JQK6_9AGAR